MNLKTDNIDHNKMDALLEHINILVDRGFGNWHVLNANFETPWHMTAYELRRLLIRYMNTQYDPRTEDNL